jgi:SAM-dependent methyltransferase
MNDIHGDVERYYTGKIKTHGRTPQGVDWNSSESQSLRFEQLTRIVDFSNSFSILDYGCGYGALVEFLSEKSRQFNYTGFDLSEEMIRSAGEIYPRTPSLQFVTNPSELRAADYVVASGIFSVKLQTAEEPWLSYITDTLHHMNALCTKGFSFNALTMYSDAEHMRHDLYYADPKFLFDYCKRNFSKKVALLHDYPLYEFTLLIRK